MSDKKERDKIINRFAYCAVTSSMLWALCSEIAEYNRVYTEKITSVLINGTGNHSIYIKGE